MVKIQKAAEYWGVKLPQNEASAESVRKGFIFLRKCAEKEIRILKNKVETLNPESDWISFRWWRLHYDRDDIMRGNFFCHFNVLLEPEEFKKIHQLLDSLAEMPKKITAEEKEANNEDNLEKIFGRYEKNKIDIRQLKEEYKLSDHGNSEGEENELSCLDYFTDGSVEKSEDRKSYSYFNNLKLEIGSDVNYLIYMLPSKKICVCLRNHKPEIREKAYQEVKRLIDKYNLKIKEE
jgi:hypothetical protein